MNIPIVDSHIHFLNPARFQYDWAADDPQLSKPFLPADLATAARDYRLEKIVFVQAECIATQALAEVDFVVALSRDEPRISAIVAAAPMELGVEAHDSLQRLRDIPLVTGVRRLIQWEAPGFCSQPPFVRAVQLLPEYDLSFDICIYHRQLRDVITLVSQCPEVRFVLDHLGKPGVEAGLLEPWHSDIAELAGFPNVHCKISGLATEADHRNWSPAQLTPYIDRVIEVFGPGRVMYGGDWPVSTRAVEYGLWIDILDSATAGFSSADKHRLFYGNADIFYRLNLA